jgi:hypothetical protein
LTKLKGRGIPLLGPSARIEPRRALLQEWRPFFFFACHQVAWRLPEPFLPSGALAFCLARLIFTHVRGHPNVQCH